MVNNDDNDDEMTFLRAVTILIAEEPSDSTLRQENDVPFEYYIFVSISHHQFTYTYISLFVYLTSVTSLY